MLFVLVRIPKQRENVLAKDAEKRIKLFFSKDRVFRNMAICFLNFNIIVYYITLQIRRRSSDLLIFGNDKPRNFKKSQGLQIG